MGEIINRVKTRFRGEEVDDELLQELVVTAKDRIKLRVGVDEFPPALDSIAVDVTVKAYRRKYFEGVSSENADSISTTFVEDILKEYSIELDAWKEKNESGGKTMVKFL